MLENKPYLLPGQFGDRHACLLLHGLGGGTYELQLLGAYLHQRGWTVQAILYPGHEGQGNQMPPSSWLDWYRHVRVTYQALQQRYQDVTVVGFSTGCPLALNLASQHPVHKLVLLAPFMALRSRWYYGLPLEAYVWLLGGLIPSVPRLRLPIADPKVQRSAQAANAYQTFSITAVRSALGLIDYVKPKLPFVQAPTLIVQSPKDTVVAPAGAQYVYRSISSPVRELYWLKVSDHQVCLDYERDEVFTTVGLFLDM